ncbi:MAG: pantoate--beta-alanine ligase [Neisseriaceae bacterium]|nr:pantoate--beta-alanine ligase [Neisseriaceae bacterium]
MQIIKTIEELRNWRKTVGTVAFVPTMGNLHAGHLALVNVAKQHADTVVVSIFVNPLQFGQGEDFAAYPRTLQADAEKLEQAGVAVLFAPDDKTLYPNTVQSFNVEPSALQNELEGKFRPGHFRGVATVVLKLFNIVEPQIACFGKKDFQQLVVIQQMVAELNVNIQIIPVDTGRAEDGLALSSRNGYLTDNERQQAPQLYAVLCEMKNELQQGRRDFSQLEQSAAEKLNAQGWQTDYVEIRRRADLSHARPDDKQLIILAAAKLGKPRLIDNLEVDL